MDDGKPFGDLQKVIYILQNHTREKAEMNRTIMPRVSVIIPNYNYAHYLRERIDSVLGQTETDMEILLLDDGSSDDSIAVMQEYANKDPRVQIIRNPQNSGSPFLQWEKGITLSSGEYIWIAEADDSAQSELLSTALHVLNNYPSVCFVQVASSMINEMGEHLSKDYDHWQRRGIQPGTTSIYDSKTFVRMQYRRNHIYNASGVVFRRDSISEEALEALREMRYSGDWLFWTILAHNKQVAEIHERLNFFRFHEQSTTHIGAYAAFQEDIRVVCSMEQKYHIPFPIRWWRRMKFMRRLGRMGFSNTEYQQLRHQILCEK